MNQVVLTGRLVKDVELKKTQTGKSVTNFRLAVYRDKDNSEFVNCIAWEKNAELLHDKAKQGYRVGVTGKLQTRNYEDQDGKKVYLTEVIANQVELFDFKPKEETNYYEDTDLLGGTLPY